MASGPICDGFSRDCSNPNPFVPPQSYKFCYAYVMNPLPINTNLVIYYSSKLYVALKNNYLSGTPKPIPRADDFGYYVIDNFQYNNITGNVYIECVSKIAPTPPTCLCPK